MQRVSDLAGAIAEIGFVCTGCGVCCRGDEESGRVIISPDEIGEICSATGWERDDIAAPYPEYIEGEGGSRFTFAWCLRRRDERCIFLSSEKRCTIYHARPWICRTYPFALEGGELSVSECPGLGGNITEADARLLATALLRREEAEEREEQAIRRIFSESAIPAGETVVFDSQGMWSIHG
ncbi:YkgJ family cysteine cluster protein [Methanocalculus alkaliphilus]|uniref:YkgJ family cysteine cluster protein n=1 Tax=Methanocalculus alkaliphilus TaxID=768730 RepID=UPI00209E5508|nr:YkgJ family cysteine cluster protein [Methanocalculus alkaliphilus]